jgi:D-alanine-D-alanine ligase
LQGVDNLTVSRVGKKLKIGITYDLRDDYLKEGYGLEETAEFDLPDTIEAIEKVILDNGFQADRIGNVTALTRRLAADNRWDLVFNIAEGMYGFGREAQIPALLDAYNIPYTFSDPLGHTLSLHKGITKHVLRDLGIPTPDFAVVNSDAEIDKVNLPFPLFAKPVAEGTSKGITALSKITNHEELYRTCKHLLRTFKQPALIERYLPGREFTVGILGTGKNANALGVIEVILKPMAEQNAYSYENKEHYENLVQYVLVDDDEARQAKGIALKVWRYLDLKDAGRVDLRSDAHGAPHFMEVNSLAGLNPKRSDLPILCNLLGMSYHVLISSIIESALRRADIKHKILH